MARRRLAIKRLDPWSVLKFGIVINVVLFAVFLLVAGVVWFIVDRLQLVDQACEIALDVGFTSCGVNPGNLFQVLALLGGMWVVVQTAVLVFLAFLYNLIADLTGGLVIGAVDDAPAGDGVSRPTGVVTASGPVPPGGAGPGTGGLGGPAGGDRDTGSGRRPSPDEPEPTRAQTPISRREEDENLFDGER